MFSPFLSAYPQRLPSSYSDNDYAYLDRDFIHALAQQRAREQREAQRRAQLHELRRQRAHQEAARRRNSLFFGGFDEEPQSGFLPTRYYYPHEDDEDQRPVEDRVQQLPIETVNPEGGIHTDAPRPTHSVSIPIMESQADNTDLVGSSRGPDTRDIAARKIQAFLRSYYLRMRALRAISDISQQFTKAHEAFRFPAELDFKDTMETGATPSLLFTPRNAPLHGHEHVLVKLLSALDAVESHGDVRVRDARKLLVNRIESALAELDAQKETIWKDLVRKASPRAETPDSGYLSEDCVEPLCSRVEESAVDLETSLSGADSDEELNVVEKEIFAAPEEVIPGDQDAMISPVDEGVRLQITK